MFSAIVFLVGAAVANTWITNALSYSAMGLVAGFTAGIVGLLLTRWEPTPNSFHFTPSRLLILSITAIVMTRLVYGFWRGWQAWQTTRKSTREPSRWRPPVVIATTQNPSQWRQTRRFEA